MTIRQLYRNRLLFSLICLIAAVAMAAVGYATFDRAKMAVSLAALIALPAMLAALAIMTFRLARDSYRFDLGLSGPPEWRRLVSEAHAWAENGYRTPDEIAAGVPPRQRPPESRP